MELYYFAIEWELTYLRSAGALCTLHHIALSFLSIYLWTENFSETWIRDNVRRDIYNMFQMVERQN